MLPTYKRMMEVVHWIIERAFSNEVIKPGKTTNQDVVWWMRQQVNDLGLGTWFQPTVRVQRKGSGIPSNLAEDAPIVIERGDVLHCDFGITAMGLADTQHMAYVLREGETDAPEGVRKALANTNRMQGHFDGANETRARTKSCRCDCDDERKDKRHVLHAPNRRSRSWRRAACRSVGSSGRRARSRRREDQTQYLVFNRAWRRTTPEWGGQELFVGQEEDAAIDGEGKISWVLKRQTKYH